MDFRSALRKRVKVKAAAQAAAFAEDHAAQARKLSKAWGFLRVTAEGYDFGPNTDPDGIMVTLRPKN